MAEPALSAVIVGSGFSGLCAAIMLRRAGIKSFVILEKAERLGGTWRDNSYPGAACDIPSHLYAYSFEPNPSWSEAYGGQPEILAYLERCAAKYQLHEHLQLKTRVVSATFDDGAATWTVRTADGRAFVARALVLGNGALHRPAIPALPGSSTFTGTRFHTARWDHDHNLTGKRVAVIGTGASAVQLIPRIAPLVEQLFVYQRTPPWVLPKADRAIGRSEQWLLHHVPGAHWLRRSGLYWLFESRAVGFVVAPKLNHVVERFARTHLERQVRDPALRAKLTPSYLLGCKRVLVSNDYYPALVRDNVELVTEAIDHVEPAAIRTSDGVQRDVDTIIYATGFKPAEYLSAVRIVGRNGTTLDDVWASSMRNYLGIAVAGFPNMFLLMGPNTGLGHNSMIFMIEAQARYAVSAIRAMRDNQLAAIDVRRDVEASFGAEMARRMPNTVWTTGCNSWYMAPDGDVMLWPGFTFEYWRRTRRFELADYQTTSVNAV
ncbi:MAG: flavin-containing monooxygenase [Kofleriaceae bacterium]